jgi:hypothetical protein
MPKSYASWQAGRQAEDKLSQPESQQNRSQTCLNYDEGLMKRLFA